jgi:hypothetical protein
MREVLLVWAVVASSLLGCSSAVRSGDLIERYKNAECIAPVRKSASSRSWSYKARIQNGEEVLVDGIEAPGGVVAVTFGSTGQREIAVRPGDYIYPADVRIDAKRQLLYVKAHGRRAWTVRPVTETLLFEYSLPLRKQTNRQLVDPVALPPECQETRTSL